MSVSLVQETDYWFGLLPDDANILGDGWMYVQNSQGMLQAIHVNSGILRYAHPYKGIVGKFETNEKEP